MAYEKELGKIVGSENVSDSPETLEAYARDESVVSPIRNFEEANTTLRVSLKRREEDIAELEDKIISNLKKLLISFVEKLKGSRLYDYQRGYIDVLESNLKDGPEDVYKQGGI